MSKDVPVTKRQRQLGQCAARAKRRGTQKKRSEAKKTKQRLRDRRKREQQQNASKKKHQAKCEAWPTCRRHQGGAQQTEAQIRETREGEETKEAAAKETYVCTSILTSSANFLAAAARVLALHRCKTAEIT